MLSISLARVGLKLRLLAGDVPAWVNRHIRADYIKAVAMSTPLWCDRSYLRPIEREAKRITRETGVRHVCDHIVPVTHPNVCGLSVPWNFQVIHWKANAIKSNKWTPDQLELFP